MNITFDQACQIYECLKPMVDAVKEYDRYNTYRPLNEMSLTLEIPFNDCVAAVKLLESLRDG